jgi:vancomycin permeability regulator SanA
MQSYAGQKYYETREVVARVKDFLTSIFKPRPTFLGEAIPVNGNGDITNDKDIYNADKDPGETEE